MNARIDPSPLLPTLADIEAAAQVVYRDFAATPQYRWGLLSQRLGTDCWLKHENHTPVGAFKIRGGLTYFDQLAQRGRLPQEVISATRGNHGQSMGWAAISTPSAVTNPPLVWPACLSLRQKSSSTPSPACARRSLALSSPPSCKPRTR